MNPLDQFLRVQLGRATRNLRAPPVLLSRSVFMRSRRPVPPAAFLSPSVALASGGHLITRAPMSRIPWHLFKVRQPRAHLVAAVVRADEADVFDLNEVQRVLRRYVRKQEPAGDYGTTIVRETGRPELYLA